ncbi:MAG: hypothetical protein ACTSPG_05425 [Candidatus Hodarchaeales archaeon]
MKSDIEGKKLGRYVTSATALITAAVLTVKSLLGSAGPHSMVYRSTHSEFRM